MLEKTSNLDGSPSNNLPETAPITSPVVSKFRLISYVSAMVVIGYVVAGLPYLGGWWATLLAGAGFASTPVVLEFSKRRSAFSAITMGIMVIFTTVKSVDDAFVYRLPDGYTDLNHPELTAPIREFKLPEAPNPRLIKTSFHDTLLPIPFSFGKVEAYLHFHADSIELNPKEREHLESWLRGRSVTERLSEELSVIVKDNMSRVGNIHAVGINGHQVGSDFFCDELEKRSPFTVKGKFEESRLP